jgi:hypothetical protein
VKRSEAEAALQETAGKIEDPPRGIHYNRIGRGDQAVVRLQGIIRGALKFDRGGKGALTDEEGPELFRHQRGKGDGGVDERVQARGAKFREEGDYLPDRLFRRIAFTEASMGGGRVAKESVVANEHEMSPEIAFHGDEDVVPIHAERISPYGFYADELAPARRRRALVHNPAEKAISGRSSQPVSVSHELEQRLFRITLFPEVFTVEICFSK